MVSESDSDSDGKCAILQNAKKNLLILRLINHAESQTCRYYGCIPDSQAYQPSEKDVEPERTFKLKKSRQNAKIGPSGTY